MSFLHPQRLAHSVTQIFPAAIMLMQGFRMSPVAAYSTSHRVLDLEHGRFPPSRAMATNQKRDGDKIVVHSANALRTLLFSAVARYDSVEVALLHIMKTHDFNISLLKRVLTGLTILF